jgi:tricarballylate dehydrogenase
LSLSRTNAFFLGGGKALLNSYYATAEQLGIKVLYDTEVRTVRMNGPTAEEVIVRQNGASVRIRAKSIVAAAGGFQGNIEWLRQYWGDAADNFVIRGTPYAQGQIMKTLLEQGVASVGDPTQFHAVAVDARAPKFDGGIVTRLDCIPFSVVVDRDAQRFYDEGEDVWPKRYAIWGRLVAKQPGQTAFSIIDKKALNLFMPSVFPAVQAGTIPELAVKLGLDPAKLAATVNAFNASVRPGTFNGGALDDCKTEGLVPPKTHWARAIDTAPFSAYPLKPGITFTYLGLKVDAKARVMMVDGTPSGNLFASGEIMSGNILGQGYLAGFGMTLGSVFGLIAGREAAKHAIN